MGSTLFTHNLRWDCVSTEAASFNQSLQSTFLSLKKCNFMFEVGGAMLVNFRSGTRRPTIKTDIFREETAFEATLSDLRNTFSLSSIT